MQYVHHSDTNGDYSTPNTSPIATQRKHPRKSPHPCRSARSDVLESRLPCIIWRVVQGKQSQYRKSRPKRKRAGKRRRTSPYGRPSDSCNEDTDDDDDDDDDDDGSSKVPRLPSSRRRRTSSNTSLSTRLRASSSESEASSPDGREEGDDGEVPFAAFASRHVHVPATIKTSGATNFLLNGARKVCGSCGTKSTPYWRDGWEGVCLCNACGIRYAKRRVACTNCNYVPRKDEKSARHCPKCDFGLFE